MHLLYNFQLLPEEDFALAYTNRAFQYNDGLFDTLMMNKGRIRFLADHLHRMQQALQILQIQIPAFWQDKEIITRHLQELADKNNLNQKLARIKVHIWRAPGGLFTPEQNTAESLITLQPQAVYHPIILRVDFAATVHNSYSPLSFFKGPFAAQYVLASLEKKQKQLDELILLDDKGSVSEALTANIFWIKENTLYTPALATGCIAGIVRKNILQINATDGLKIVEGFFKASDLLLAEAVFTSNVTGLRPIQFIQDVEFSISHPIIARLHSLLFPN